MIETIAIVGCIGFVALVALVFYLASLLARTNGHLLRQNELTMRHALAINEDCREFERIRVDAALRPPHVPRAPASAFRTEPDPLPIDGQIPISENGEVDYVALERG